MNRCAKENSQSLLDMDSHSQARLAERNRGANLVIHLHVCESYFSCHSQGITPHNTLRNATQQTQSTSTQHQAIHYTALHSKHRKHRHRIKQYITQRYTASTEHTQTALSKTLYSKIYSCLGRVFFIKVVNV